MVAVWLILPTFGGQLSTKLSTKRDFKEKSHRSRVANQSLGVMATYKIELNKYKQLSDGTHPVAIRYTVTINGKTYTRPIHLQPSTDYRATLDEWEWTVKMKNGRPVMKDGEPVVENGTRFTKHKMNYRALNKRLGEYELRASEILAGQQLTIDQFRDAFFNRQATGESLVEYMKEHAAEIYAGQTNLSLRVTSIANKLADFAPEIKIGEFDYDFVKRWVKHLKTINKDSSIKVDVSKAIQCYEEACERFGRQPENLRGKHSPLKGLEAVGKQKAITLDMVKAFVQVEIDKDAEPVMWRAHRLAMLSFLMSGENLADMVRWKSSRVKNGKVSRKRSKTKRSQEKTIPKPAQAIIDSFNHSGEYVLPFLEGTTTEAERVVITNHLNDRNNKALKRVFKRIGVDGGTMYWFRRGWGRIQRERGVDILVIRDGYGHKLLATTEHYIGNVDTDEIDDANNELFNDLL